MGNPNPPTSNHANEPAALTDDLRMYRLVRRIRLFEESLVSLFGEGKVYGTAHTCIGQEAVAVGALFDLTPDDFVTGTHRSHGHCIAKGADVGAMMAELLGRANGYCGGKGGSMHIADLDLNMLGCNGLVSAGVPHAAGAAMAAGLRGENRVAVAFHGDGAANQGILYETLNLAAVWRLPLIVVCENNQYAMTTPYAISQAGESIAARAAGFGIPAQVVDGMDVHAVRDAIRVAIERDGPAKDRPSSSAGHIDTPGTRFATTAPCEAKRRLRRGRPATRCRPSPTASTSTTACRPPRPPQSTRRSAHESKPPSRRRRRLPSPVRRCWRPGSIARNPTKRPRPPEPRQTRAGSSPMRALSTKGCTRRWRMTPAFSCSERTWPRAGGVFGVSNGLKERFGAKRVRDTPISEQAIAGLGVGLALADARPVVEIQFMDILTLAADQIVNQAAKIRYMLADAPGFPSWCAHRSAQGQARRPALPEPRDLVHARAGPHRGRPEHSLRREGDVDGGVAQPQSGRVSRAQAALLPLRARSGGGVYPAPRRRQGPARG